MKNIFSVDVEEWYHANFNSNNSNVDRSIVRVEHGVEIILRILNDTNSKATFFILGETAKKHVQMVKKIAALGNEIASHSYHHDTIYNMDRKQFRFQAIKSKALLEDISGTEVSGFRAPSWSVDNKRTPWFWEELKKCGYNYSSSLFPFRTFLYGDNNAPRFQFEIDGLVEIPPTTAILFKKRIPFSGGFYLRALPLKAVLYMSNRINKLERRHNIFYIHPREVDVFQPKLKLSLRDSLIHNWGISSTESKLRKLLARFPCVSFSDSF